LYQDAPRGMGKGTLYIATKVYMKKVIVSIETGYRPYARK